MAVYQFVPEGSKGFLEKLLNTRMDTTLSFRHFLETLRVADAAARSRLQAHPLVREGTFGVEVEFVVTGMPTPQWDDDFLAASLEDTAFEHDLQQRHASTEGEDPDTGEVVTTTMSRREWNRFFESYVKSHKQEAVDAWMEEFGEDTENRGWSLMRGHWQRVVQKMIHDAGFPVSSGNSSGRRWGVGEDGLDTEDNKPVVEVRTGVLTAADVPGLEKVLVGFQRLFAANKSYLRVAGNTGLHVHVSNPAINRPGGPDPFTRLASIASVDEDRIWDDSAPHDRAFEKFAALNRQQDFSSYGDKGFHQMVIEWVWYRLNPDRTKVSSMPRGPASFSVSVTADQLADFMSGFERNVGVNAKSRQPTVEYRQLSSAMLADPQGPARVIDYIRYFLENTASLSNKNQFSVKDDDTRVTFTRLRGGAKIDFQRRASSDDRFRRVAQAGDTADAMRSHPRDQAPPWQAGRFVPVARVAPRGFQPPQDPDEAARDFRRMFDDAE